MTERRLPADRRRAPRPSRERRRPGRPREIQGDGSAVCTWLDAREHDRLIAIATQKRTSVSAVVRDAVRAFVV